MNLFCVLILLLLTSCSTHKTDEAGLNTDLSALKVKQDLYIAQIRAVASTQLGWLSQGCDALLFSSLFAASQPDAAVFYQATKAEDSPGHWQRRNADLTPCYPSDAPTTISKDMLLGLTWFAYYSQQPDILVRLTDYGLAHGWVMGEPSDDQNTLGRVVVTPALAGLMYQVLYRLGGPDHPSRHIPDVYPSGLVGFEAHLQVLDILLHGVVDDKQGASDAALQRLRDQADRQPKNPFFAVALALYTGDATKAIALLNDETQYPADHLPDSSNHCDPWPIQRDDGADWQPCMQLESSTIYGGDFVFMVDLLLKANAWQQN